MLEMFCGLLSADRTMRILSDSSILKPSRSQRAGEWQRRVSQ